MIEVIKATKENGEMLPTRIKPFTVKSLEEMEAERLKLQKQYGKKIYFTYRDLNAAKNILNEGLKIISAGTVDNTGGDLNQTSFEKHRSMKPEAHLSLANG